MNTIFDDDEDEVIWVEEIDHTKDSVPIMAIYRDADGAISFSSTMSAINTARLLTGLSNHILETHIGERS